MKLFDAFKQYIISHPKEVAYKPTSDNYDRTALLTITNKFPLDDIEDTQEERDKIHDFIEISDYYHGLVDEAYSFMKKVFDDFNMKGENTISYFIALLNREHKIIFDKNWQEVKKRPRGLYAFHDLTDPKLQLPDGSFVDARSALECATDAIGMLCNYMRFFLDKEFKNEVADPQHFAGNALRVFHVADICVAFKQSYDDILYNGGYIKLDPKKQVFFFDYDNYQNLRLLKAGNMMFGERIAYVYNKYRHERKILGLEKYVSNYRIKRVKSHDGYVTLEFGQGEPKAHKELVLDIESAIGAFYDYLDLNIVLDKIGTGLMLEEVLAVWTALRYICRETFVKLDFDFSMYTKEEMDLIPRLFKKEELIAYIQKLTGIKKHKVRAALESFEVDWHRFNDIWTSPLMLNHSCYSVPFFPIIDYVPYNVIDTILERGGHSLDDRGKVFETFLYKRIVNQKHLFYTACHPSKFYGTSGNGEEIDLIIELKELIIVCEAKCIHYSMEAIDYYNARKRLENGAVQAKRKASFVETHPDLFANLGEVSTRKVMPLVVTNYPNFTGFEFDGVYVIDSHSFISYFNAGYLSMNELSSTDYSLRGMCFFYSDEDQYSSNFEPFVQKNPIKELYMKQIDVDNISLLPQIDPWKCYAKSAIYKGYTSINITNGPAESLTN